MEKIKVDYSTLQVPAAVKNFMPDVYEDGEKYICILGIGANQVKGEGDSIEIALNDWNEKYKLASGIR